MAASGLVQEEDGTSNCTNRIGKASVLQSVTVNNKPKLAMPSAQTSSAARNPQPLQFEMLHTSPTRSVTCTKYSTTHDGTSENLASASVRSWHVELQTCLDQCGLESKWKVCRIVNMSEAPYACKCQCAETRQAPWSRKLPRSKGVCEAF